MKLSQLFTARRGHDLPQQKLSSSPAINVTLPDLIRLAEYAAPLGAHPGRQRALMAGNYLTRIKGRGMEFDEVRAYVPGDDVRSLDWRVTARTGKPHTKMFHEERERPVFISVDYSRSMFFATRGQFKSVLAAQLAALCAWRAFQHGDRVGGQVFHEQDIQEIRPRNSKATLLHFLKALAENSAPGDHKNIAAAETGSHFDHSLARLCRHARPGSLIFLISDFRKMTPASYDHLLKLNRHCDVVLYALYDPLEKSLPPGGHYRLQAGSRSVRIDTHSNTLRQQYENRFSQRQFEMEQFASRQDLGLIHCSTTDKAEKIFQMTAPGHG